MRALVLNLAQATERLAFMAGQLDALGLEWERIEAVTPDTLDPPADDPVWHRWERPLRSTEMAACASHMAAWRRHPGAWPNPASCWRMTRFWTARCLTCCPASARASWPSTTSASRPAGRKKLLVARP
jgi:hypothetical protein